MSDDLVKKLLSQIGDDVQEVYSHEALFRLAAARIAALEAALKDISRQKKTDEMETETDVEYADFEGAHDMMIDVARAALRAGQ